MKISLYRTMRYTLAILLFLSVCTSISAQRGSRPSTISGTVYDTSGEPVAFANVSLKDTRAGVSSGTDGSYTLRVPSGEYILRVSMIGFKPYESDIRISDNEHLDLDITLQEDNIIEQIEVVVSPVQHINRTAYNVVAIDAQALHNSNLNLADALDRVSGIRIKETGGVGSDAQITLNGFSGRHVKVFMDGVPLEGSGSAISVNNIPVNFADRIEVYKGVVPIELGADALGGAINIVSKNSSNTFVDAAYSFGSFNTHKSNLSFGHTAKSGFSFQVSAYQNYSDNNYKVKTNLLDVDTGVYSTEEYWFRRFHDKYRNEVIVAKAGVMGKSWADRLMLEMTYSQEKADIQNANLMKIVYGGKARSAKSYIPALTYEKRDLFTDGLNFSLMAKYNHVVSSSIDTLARQYNWNGDYREKSSKGEAGYSMSEFDNNSAYVTGNLNYRLGGGHHFALNHVFNTYTRKNNDSAASAETVTEATFMKRKNTKNVLGFSYKFDHNGIWNVSAFAKYYDVSVDGPVNVSEGSSDVYELRSRKFNTTGYGGALTYVVTDYLRLKGSVEKAYRLPTERELFGDEILETGDSQLKPENSWNINFNLSFDHTFDRTHSVFVDAGLIYRDTRDYIRRQVEQRYGGAYYTNHGKVRNMGVDIEARYFYKRSLSAGGSFSYQDIRNMERYSVTGQELVYYKDRMPNQPYVFANADAAYNFFDILGKGNTLTLGYNMQWVYKFYKSWASERGSGTNIFIPTQLTHDLCLNFSMKNGTYNIAFEARNIADKMVFDNYSLQKPGRNFNLKLRYYFFHAR